MARSILFPDGALDDLCEVCYKSPAACICPVCLVCGEVGDATCYIEHDLLFTADQMASIMAYEAEEALRIEAEIELEHRLLHQLY